MTQSGTSETLALAGAEAIYRGSKIVAYFTSEIPTVFGPAKFGGLPGLILEVNDVTPGYSNSYTAYEISFNSNQPLKIIEKTKSFIDYKSYVKINDSIAEEKTNAFIRKMRANSPRGYRTEKKVNKNDRVSKKSTNGKRNNLKF